MHVQVTACRIDSITDGLSTGPQPCAVHVSPEPSEAQHNRSMRLHMHRRICIMNMHNCGSRSALARAAGLRHDV